MQESRDQASDGAARQAQQCAKRSRRAKRSFALLGAEKVQNLLLLRKAAGVVLAEHELAVLLHVENPTAAGDELRLDAQAFPDRGRQTGGAGQIVSLVAVGDAYLHRGLHTS